MIKRRGSRAAVPVRPELAGELAPLAARCGVTKPGDLAALAKTVASLRAKREHGVAQHGPQVATHLQQLGLTQEQLGALLLRCPLLFGWPKKERAAPLFGQLVGRLGLTPDEAAKCFQQAPSAAHMPSFEPAIEALAELFVDGSGGDSSGSTGAAAQRREGERQLGGLLRSVPAAVLLLELDAAKLRQRCAALQQRYGLSAKQLLAAVKNTNAALLALDGDNLPGKEAALQEELGVCGRALVGAMLCSAPRAATCSVETLRERAQALAQARAV